MNGEKVADIVKGQDDATGNRIDTVYSKIGSVFAVYCTAERVMIQYADDQALGLEQRRALAPLNPLRGEINGLVDGWRNSGNAKDRCRARMFDRRTADALTAALQGDQLHAEELLTAVKDEVLEERVSMGRTEYLLFATFAALVVFLLFGAITYGEARNADTLGIGAFVVANELWLAAGMGCLGALFSIGLSIRRRDIRTDLQRRDNVADAVLRIMIGAVSAIILFSLIRSDMVTFGLGTSEIAMGAPDAAIVVAFIAGFSERLVGDYLSRAVLAPAGEATSTAAGASPALQAAAQPEVEANERNPRGKLEVDLANRAAVATAGDRDTHVHEEDADDCGCGLRLLPEERTDDTELPEATGGVAKAA